MLVTINGKSHTINDKELARSMKAYNLTEDEAIKMILEDEGILTNEEQEELVKATKNQRHYEKSTAPKTKRTRTVKVDETKVQIIQIVKEALESVEGLEVSVLNEQKLIEIRKGDETFKLDLIKQRKKKGE